MYPCEGPGIRCIANSKGRHRMHIKKLARPDMRKVEEIAHDRFWDQPWTCEEGDTPDESLCGKLPDFIASDGHGRTVEIVIRIKVHPD